MQAQQHLRALVAEIVDDAVVQAAIARAGIEREVRNVERAQHRGDASLPQIGVLAGVRLAGRSRLRIEGWALLAGAFAAAGAALVFAVVTVGSLGSGGQIRPHRTGSQPLTQPGEQRHARIAVGGLHADFALEIPHGDHRIVADAAVGATGIETERGETLLDLLQLGERRRALAARKLLHQGLGAHDAVAGEHDQRAAGDRRPMERLFQLLETVAPTNSTILITGETGTGKEVVARAIHHNSPRRVHRFVALNCSAIPETLLEAELFGHVRGAFTGAVGNRQGRLEQAHKGTLFLDEVGTMSAALQMKLLRVLQEREFERVGDSHTIKVDVRVIAATNSDLAKLVAEGQFREDLFYRLNVIPVQLPALRERKEDIPLLVQHFLAKFEAERDASAAAGNTKAADRLPRVTVSQEGMRLLMAYQWPGNVRQLENAIERAVAFTAGRSQIDVDDLPTEVQQAKETAAASSVTLPEDGMDLEAFVANIERELIQRSLDRTNGNKGQAARLLNLKRTTLVEKLKRLHK